MKLVLLAALSAISAFAIAAEAPTTKPTAKVARPVADPAKEAEHSKEDIKRHRTIAAAHEATAKCKESGKGEDFCNAELAKACKGIAYGKFCGMRHQE